ncbi:MAG TPA: hypothetical protein VGU66_16880 [Candidatus Elarobacter sp.]|nr:hypothetical protein [Candidatus Elarobacter sp.]
MNAAVPPVDLAAIRRRMNALSERPFGRPVRARLALASAAAIIAGLFLTTASPALMQSVEERYAAALHAAGIGPRIPTALPQDVRSVINPSQVSLATAKQRANFVLVPPIGLPHDIANRRIFTAPLAVWSKQENAWSADGVQVTFGYVRRDGRAFDIIADRYSALSLPAPRYIYNVDDVPRTGKPNLRDRGENFVWRNGDQMVHMVASAAISAGEIDRIRAAMHGIPLPRYDGHSRKPVENRVERFAIPR